MKHKYHVKLEANPVTKEAAVHAIHEEACRMRHVARYVSGGHDYERFTTLANELDQVAAMIEKTESEEVKDAYRQST